MHPLESYLKSLQSIHLSGQAVPETAYYPALSELLNIAAILLLGPALDANYEAVKEDTWTWPIGR